MRPIHLYACAAILGAGIMAAAWLLSQAKPRYTFSLTRDSAGVFRLDTITGRIELTAIANGRLVTIPITEATSLPPGFSLLADKPFNADEYLKDSARKP